MQKQNPENERIKRKFFTYLQGPLGRDETTIQKHADAIAWFEKTTGHKSFKKFHIDQAVKFRTQLQTATNRRTGKPLTAGTMDGQVRMLKAFFVWLSQQHGYKSRIGHTDADYFNLSRAERRIAHTSKRKQIASLQQCKRAFDLMPSATSLQRRDKALFACFMITGIRDGAAASLPLSCVDIDERLIYQDARLMRTKAAKTITSYFLPVDPAYEACFSEWVNYLQNELLFGHDDPVFPKPEIGLGENGFQNMGLSREFYSSASKIREVIKSAFTSAGFPPFAPHSLRSTLTRWADKHYTSREAFKAFSQNLGHESVVTTVGSYCPVDEERQGELIKGL